MSSCAYAEPEVPYASRVEKPGVRGGVDARVEQQEEGRRAGWCRHRGVRGMIRIKADP